MTLLNKMGLGASSVIFSVLACLLSHSVRADYTHTAYLDANKTIEFKWSIGDSSKYLSAAVNAGTSDVLVAQLTVPTRGYMSWGISPNGGMPGANMLVMWVDDADGTVHVQDRHATDFIEPDVVADSDAVLSYDGSQNATHTVVQFVRWLNAGCKNELDLSITSNSLDIIYAFGDADPDADGHIQYHGSTNRGGQTLYLLDDANGDFERNKAAAWRDGIAYDYTADHFQVPAQDTLYQCTYYQLPEITEDVEIVGFEPIVQTNNTDIIHHFLLHMCEYDAFTPDTPPTVPAFACYDTPPDKVDKNASLCIGNEFWVWGVGGTGTYMPENIGFRLTPQDSRRYFLLEIHYNNPTLSANRVDNSGFRLIITENKLRPDETSMLIVSVPADESVIIPGNTPVFTMPGLCHSECTEKFIDQPSGTYMFNVFLHSHLLGKSMALRQFRNGVELPAVTSDETYDFNYQQYRPTNRSLLPGDSLIVECNYSSTARTQRSNTTLGGLSTSQEMCVAIIFVSPPIPLRFCASIVNYTKLYSMTNASDIVYPVNGTWDQIKQYRQEMNDRLKTIQWTPENAPLVASLQNFYENSIQIYGCGPQNASASITGTDTLMPGGRWKAFVPPDTCTASNKVNV